MFPFFLFLSFVCLYERWLYLIMDLYQDACIIARGMSISRTTYHYITATTTAEPESAIKSINLHVFIPSRAANDTCLLMIPVLIFLRGSPGVCKVRD
ncbi:hypothetical protein HOY82DRAFT_123969 [Tuber indicum]|nr:hypothetical protein HOY82DRAFT_123969 [Tuber indicum]